MSMEIIGIVEMAKHFRISRNSLYVRMRKSDFPRELFTLSGSRAFDWSEVAAYFAAHPVKRRRWAKKPVSV